MLSFFHGWRRKGGVVSLVLALVVCGAWVRSRIVMDRCANYTKTNWRTLTSYGSTLWFEDRHAVEGPANHWPGVSFRSAIGLYGVTAWSPYDGFVSPSFRELPILHRRRFAGFDFGEYQVRIPNQVPPETTYRCQVWGIPYWPVAVPLTLLSAYLILWKPRKRAPATPTN